MSSVTIRGSIMPCSFLARGAETTVQRTPFVERLIEQGFVDVIAELDVSDDGSYHISAPSEGEITMIDPPSPHYPGVPHRNASREDWAEFMADKTVTQDKTRADLIDEWDALATVQSPEPPAEA